MIVLTDQRADAHPPSSFSYSYAAALFASALGGIQVTALVAATQPQQRGDLADALFGFMTRLATVGSL
jgi:hypothetical protein